LSQVRIPTSSMRPSKPLLSTWKHELYLGPEPHRSQDSAPGSKGNSNGNQKGRVGVYRRFHPQMYADDHTGWVGACRKVTALMYADEHLSCTWWQEIPGPPMDRTILCLSLSDPEVLESTGDSATCGRCGVRCGRCGDQPRYHDRASKDARGTR